MAIVTGAFSQLLSPGLAKVMSTEYEFVEYVEYFVKDDFSPPEYKIIKQAMARKRRRLPGGFCVFDVGEGMLAPSEMVEDRIVR